MGIQINGNTNNINAGIGSLSIEDLNELDIIGVATASNFKTGSSNLHSTGLTVGNALVHSTGINVGTGATVHSPASNVLTIGTNSNERLRITSDGKIGVNNTSPTARLHVSDSSFHLARFTRSGGQAGVTIEGNYATEAVYLSLRTLNNTANSGCVIEGVDASGNGTSWIKLFTENDSTNAGAISLHTRPAGGSTTERLRITSAGLVGIGKDNPSNALDVQGGTSNTAIVARSTDAKAQISLLDNSTTSVGSVAIGAEGDALFLTSGSGGTERLRIKSDGKIDIGGSTRTGNAARLTVTHTNSSGVGLIDIDAYGSATLQIRSNWSGSTINGMPNETFGFGTPHQYPLVFTTHGTERLRIESGGNALFTTNQVKLYNNIDTSNTYFYAQNTGAGNAGIKMKNNQGEWTIIANDRLRFIDDDASTERFSIASNGKIGINNTSPECRGGGIDMSSNVGTSGKSFTDLRGESQLIIRNPSTTQHSFTQLLFENGGGTSAATMFRHRLGSSQGSLQNFVGDLCLFRRTGNAGGANNDYRESTRWCGSNVQARQIWWAYGDSDTSNTNRLGWHHLSAQRDHPGTDAYSFFRLETGAASYARQGWGKYTCAWTTGHASGYGLATGHFGYYMHHGNSRIYVNEHIIYRERYSNGSYYGWDDGPNLRICNSTESGGTNACIVFRAGGRRYSGGYDMSVMVGLFIDLYVPESANGDSNPRLYVAGDSQSNLDGGGHGSPVNHDYVSFQSSNPNHSGQP